MMLPMTATDDTALAHLQEGIAAEQATEWRDAVAAYEHCLSEAASGAIDEADVLTLLGRC